MAMAFSDLVSLLVFLAALVMVRALEKEIAAISASSPRQVAGGLGFLALATLARMLFRAGVFDALPFLSEVVFFDLAYWIVVITGGTFIINGVARWLPLARRNYGLSERRLRRLQFLRKIEQLLEVESRLPKFLAAAAEYISGHLPGVAVAAYLRADDRGALYRVSETTDSQSLPNELTLPQSGVASHPTANRLAWVEVFGAEQCPPAVLLLPITTERGVEVLLACNSDSPGGFDPEDELVLRLAADTIARKIRADQYERRARSLGERRARLAELTNGIFQADDLRSAAAILFNLTSLCLPYEYACLTLPGDGGRSSQRYSIGADGRMLVEHEVEIPPRLALTGPAYHKGEICEYGDLGIGRRPESREIVAAGTVRALVAAPYVFHAGVAMVLTLASSRLQAFTGARAWLRDLHPAMALLATRFRAATSDTRAAETELPTAPTGEEVSPPVESGSRAVRPSCRVSTY